MARIGEDGGIAGLDAFDKRGDGLVHRAAREVGFERDLVEALGAEKLGVGLSIGNRFREAAKDAGIRCSR